MLCCPISIWLMLSSAIKERPLSVLILTPRNTGKWKGSTFFHEFSLASNLTSPLETISPMGIFFPFASATTIGVLLVKRRSERQRKQENTLFTVFFMDTSLFFFCFLFQSDFVRLRGMTLQKVI